MTTETSANIQLVRSYLQAIEEGEVGESLARFFTADALQVEHPNQLNPKGQTSTLAEIQSRSLAGRHILRSQTFEVNSIVATARSVAVEARWTGVLAAPLGTMTAGEEVRTNFAAFFECEHGRIRRQRTYGCYEPR